MIAARMQASAVKQLTPVSLHTHTKKVQKEMIPV
jgi:hypothetical protein